MDARCKGGNQAMFDQTNLITELQKAVIEFKIDACRALAFDALAHGVDPIPAVMNGLAKGMEKVGKLYDANHYFVPEVLLSAEAFYAGLEIIEPQLKQSQRPSKARIVIGCVKGDVHDIGKNLVKMMFHTAGWEVHDLGCDVPLEQFVEKVLAVDADILAMSAMMSTTMMGMKKVISMVRSQGLDCLILLGGAPVTRDIADLFGADGYAPSAGKVVREGVDMLARSKKLLHQ